MITSIVIISVEKCSLETKIYCLAKALNLNLSHAVIIQYSSSHCGDYQA